MRKVFFYYYSGWTIMLLVCLGLIDGEWGQSFDLVIFAMGSLKTR